MNPIVKGLVQVATVKHVQSINEMVSILFRHRNYYKQYAACDLKLKFREYEVLEIDLQSLVSCHEFNPPVIELWYLNSVLKSFELLEGRYISSIGEKNYEFMMALEVIREALELIGIALFDDFQTKLF